MKNMGNFCSWKYSFLKVYFHNCKSQFISQHGFILVFVFDYKMLPVNEFTSEEFGIH